MSLEERVLLAQADKNRTDELIKEYRHFISSCSYKIIGRFVTDQDDEMSIAMIAFHEAIEKYDPTKGKFLSFAGTNIKNRLIDYQRKENKHSKVYPFSSLSSSDHDGHTLEFDIEDTAPLISDAKYEIEALSVELDRHGISFTDLTKASPKSMKTKSACAKIIRFILENEDLVHEIKIREHIPIQMIIENLKLSRKIAERHRKYIIAAVLVFSGEYHIIAEYFKPVKEVLACKE